MPAETNINFNLNLSRFRGTVHFITPTLSKQTIKRHATKSLVSGHMIDRGEGMARVCIK